MTLKTTKSKQGKGWVYVVTNQGYKDLVKIGFTLKLPEERVKDKDFNGAGSPYAYIVEYEVLVSNAYLLEQETHDFLNLKRKNENKEWFRCNVTEAIETIKSVASEKRIKIYLERPETKNKFTLKKPVLAENSNIFNNTQHDVFNTNNTTVEKSDVFFQYETLAELGDVKAQYELALLYQTGRIIEGNYELAIEWYEKSANQSYILAQINLGLLYLNTIGFKNYEKARQWLIKAAEQNNALAQYYLATVYQQGLGVPVNLSEAEHWYFKAIKNGDDAIKRKVIRACLLNQRE